MTYRDTQRMEVRSLVRLASDIVAPFSPMTVFVHHNPLHHLESLDFEEAVSRAARLLGSQGYLPNHQYRRYVTSGRIGLEQVDQALHARAEDKAVMLGDRRVSHAEVLRAALLHDLTPPPGDRPVSEAGASEERSIVEVLTERLGAALPAGDGSMQMKALAQDTFAALPPQETLTLWCDRTFGTRLMPELNQQLTKWCATFLDEGQATWEMPGREEGFYKTWKRLAAKDWTLTLSGVRGWRHSMEQLPDQAEDAILDSLHTLAVPKAVWSEYFALHLAAMPGWSAYIKWRSEQQTAWQEACPISLVKYIAVRLFYERVLVTATCAEHGIEGRWDAIQTFIEHHPQAYALQRAQVAGRLPRKYARRVKGLRQSREAGQWETLFSRYQAEWGAALREGEAKTAAERLLGLARALKIEAAALRDAAPSDLDTLLGWLAAFPEHSHGPVWLAAFEASYQEKLLAQLTVGRDLDHASAGDL
jgi:uncharacterized protein